MAKIDLSNMSKKILKAIEKNSPHILTGTGIAGMITATVLAVKATPKALVLIEEEKRKQNRDLLDKSKKNGDVECKQITKLKKTEVVKACWKCYIPALMIGTLSSACLILSNRINTRRITALAAVCKLSETALTEYKEKVIETIGEKKELEVRDNIIKDKIEKNPVTTSEVIITDKGETLCYDLLLDKYFKSDIESIRRAINILNNRMINDMYVSLSELYDELNLKHTSMSDRLGWNIDQGLIEISFSSQIAEDGRPCIVLNYLTEPKYDFSTLM